MGRILVTPRSVTKSGHPAIERLRDAGHEVVFCTPGKQPDEAELLALLPGCIGYLAGVEPVSGAVLDAAAHTLRVISRNGTGTDALDIPATRRLGIQVCRAAGANARGVAELAVSLLLALARQVPSSDTALKQGVWERRKGIELEGRTLGIIGCGQIGRLVVPMALGMGMRVLGYDLFEDPLFQPGSDFQYAPFEEVLAGSDAVTLHCPAHEEGCALIGQAALARMKSGTFLINTARASLIDREALLAALDSGHIAGAALDVFENEPPGADPLARHDRIITTPHIGGFTQESVDRAMDMAVTNLLAALGEC